MSFARNRSRFRVRLCSRPIVLFPSSPFPLPISCPPLVILSPSVALIHVPVTRSMFLARAMPYCIGYMPTDSICPHRLISIFQRRLMYADLLYYAYRGNCLVHYSKNRLGEKSISIHKDCAEDEEFQKEE